MMFELRDYQIDMIDRTRKSLKSNQRVLLQSPTGCHAPGHEILMLDGSIKKVEDIVIGDFLMGPDSTGREVLELHSGSQEMIKITPIKGCSFIVNKDHILNLYITPQKKGIKPSYENVTAEQYMVGTKWFKHIRKLHRVPVDFEKKELPIDPWFFGVLLGDGSLTSSTPSITTGNDAVVDGCVKYIEKIGMTASFIKNKRNIYQINFRKIEWNPSHKSYLQIKLEELGVAYKKSGDKFIPNQYLISDRADRLSLLAGLIDTDGSLSKGGYDYISKSKQLADDIVFLCRSLGLAAYMRHTIKGCQNGFKGDYYRVYISGDCSIIPCVTNKKSGKRKINKNHLVTGFSAEPVGEGDYFGFTVDGDNLYVDSSFTVHHNSGKTAISCHMMKTAAERGMRSFFLVHQNELLTQTSKSLWHNKLQHGMIASGRSRTDSMVQLASVMTLKNRLDYYDEPALIIIDESHRALAKTYVDIVSHYENSKVVGLTATPRRTDGKGLGHLFQDIVDGPSIRYLIDNGYLCDYELFGVPMVADTDGIKTTRGDYDTAQASEAMNKPHVTGDAIEHYKKLAYGRKTVVMCVDVNHAETVAKAYNDAGIKAQAIHGKSSGREKIISDFENGDTMVLTSVQLLIEGIDLPLIACCQWLRPTMSLVIYMQGNGRGLRPHESKDFLLILDHAGNFKRHGLPCDPREWDLLDSKKSKNSNSDQTLSVQTCKKCYLSFRSGVHVCPHCGAEVEFKERKLLTVDGELERIASAAAIEKERKMARQEQGVAKKIDELVKIGVRRDMKDPAFWAAKVFSSRPGNPSFNRCFAEARKHLLHIRNGAQ